MKVPKTKTKGTSLRTEKNHSIMHHCETLEPKKYNKDNHKHF